MYSLSLPTHHVWLLPLVTSSGTTKKSVALSALIRLESPSLYLLTGRALISQGHQKSLSFSLDSPHPPLFFTSLTYPSSAISLLSTRSSLGGALFMHCCWQASPGPLPVTNTEHWGWKFQEKAASVGGETPTRGHGHGPLPSPLLFATALSQITKHLFLTADGEELARSPDSYILISVYSAARKENLSQKNIIHLTLPPNICSLIAFFFFFFSHRSPKGTNGVLYFQLQRKKKIIWGQII